VSVKKSKEGRADSGVSVGEKLSRERRKKNLSLDEIANHTKIAKHFLIALEEDAVQKLPGGIYSRNFLRSYARVLGLDEDIITLEFYEQFNIKPTTVQHREQTRMDNQEYIAEKRRAAMLLVITLVIVGVVGYFAYRMVLPLIQEQPVAVSKERLFPAVSSPAADLHPPEVVAETMELKENPAFTQEDLSPVEVLDHARAGDGARLGTEQETTEGIDAVEIPVEDGLTRKLPLSAVVIEDVVGAGAFAQGLSLEEVFSVEAFSDVWLVVRIDGAEKTNRLMRPGDMRSYRMGLNHEIVCGDFSRLSLQVGSLYFGQITPEAGIHATLRFGPRDSEEKVARFRERHDASKPKE
jgi:cytoskeletal protein RodZ